MLCFGFYPFVQFFKRKAESPKVFHKAFEKARKTGKTRGSVQRLYSGIVRIRLFIFVKIGPFFQ